MAFSLQTYKAIEVEKGFLKVKRPISLKTAMDFSENFLTEITMAFQLWWGDFLNWCEDHFDERYSQVVPEEIETSSLLKWKWVCRKVPPDIRCRMTNLKYSHFEELAALDDIDVMTEMAQRANDGSWTVRKLREEVSPKKGRDPVKKEVQCPKCGERFEI